MSRRVPAKWSEIRRGDHLNAAGMEVYTKCLVTSERDLCERLFGLAAVLIARLLVEGVLAIARPLEAVRECLDSVW